MTEVTIKNTITLKHDKPVYEVWFSLIDGIKKDVEVLKDPGHMKGDEVLCLTTGKPIVLEYLECSEHGEVQNNLALLDENNKPLNKSGECPLCKKEMTPTL